MRSMIGCAGMFAAVGFVIGIFLSLLATGAVSAKKRKRPQAALLRMFDRGNALLRRLRQFGLNRLHDLL